MLAAPIAHATGGASGTSGLKRAGAPRKWSAVLRVQRVVASMVPRIGSRPLERWPARHGHHGG